MLLLYLFERDIRYLSQENLSNKISKFAYWYFDALQQLKRFRGASA